MSQIPSPFEGKQPTYVDKQSGRALYGVTREEAIIDYEPILNARGDVVGIEPKESTITVLVDGETRDLKTGQSDTKYWQPDMVHPAECPHEFIMIDGTKREVECKNCTRISTFNAATEYLEKDGRAYVVVDKRYYPLVSN